MVGQKQPGGVGQRYSTYIDELREFFTSRSVRFGAPEDLVPFARQVAEIGPFQEEMGSMVRTFTYQEEDLGRGELLELVTVAVGGPELDGSSPVVQASVRQIFLFLNAALRQTQPGYADSEEAQTPEVTREREPFPVYGSAPLQETDPSPASLKVPFEAPARPQAGNEVLYRAMSLSAEDVSAPAGRPAIPITSRPMARGSRVPWWIIPAVGVALAAFGAGIYVARPAADHTQKLRGMTVADSPQETPSEAAPSCVAPMAAGVTRSGLEERSRWAHNLLEQQLYEAALPELREISRLDPGYPGIKLDESDALLHMKRPEDAREAIDTQISVSECLTTLPGPALDTYCSAQYSSGAVGSCRPQLTHIRQAAELQAALVHLELGHSVQTDVSTTAAVEELNKESRPSARKQKVAIVNPEPKTERLEPLPPASEGDAEQPSLPRPATRQASGRKGKEGGSLVHGEGTDSAYGAYKKPE